jgi:lipoprotein signal peptidase
MKALADRSYVWLFWLLAVIGLTADQGSKYGIFTWLYSDGTPREEEVFLGSFSIVTKVERREFPYPTRELKLVPGIFDIIASHTHEPNEGSDPGFSLRGVSGDHLPYVNRGALFGWGGGHDGGADLNTLFAVVSLAAALGIAFWSTRPTTRRDRILSAALGLILAGTLGNFYDRIVFAGVRDFLHWYKWYDWPVFNIADCCLVCGATLLLAHAFFAVEEPLAEASATTAVHDPAIAQTQAVAETQAEPAVPAQN